MIMENTHLSSSSCSREKSVYIWFRKSQEPSPTTTSSPEKREKSTWYKLDPSQLHSPESNLTLISEIYLNHASSAVTCESAIYVLGGSPRRKSQREKTCEVYYLDTRRPDLGWKSGPPLISPRTEVTTAVKGGKIYVFRGVETKKKKGYLDSTDGCDNDHYGEVLDPFLNTWRSIAGPEHETQIKYKLYYEPDYEFGVVTYKQYQGTYCYELESGTWKSAHGHWGDETAIVDGIVYYYYKSKVRAFDMKRRKDLEGSIRGLEGIGGVFPPESTFDEPTVFVVHVGDGRLCLLWESEMGIHCTKIRVSVHRDDDNGDEDEELEVLASFEAFKVFSNYEPRVYKSKSRDDGCLKACLAL